MTNVSSRNRIPSLLEEVLRQQSQLGRQLEALEMRLERAMMRLERISPGHSTMAGSALPADIDGRRNALRPPVVRFLFLTAPIFPGDTTNFYLVNSHLYRCIRGAFVRALGPDVPMGEGFLQFFQETGSWLVHLPPEPRRGRGRPNRTVMRNREAFLTEMLRSTNPERVVAVKAKLAPLLAAAARDAGLAADRIEVFPTPRALWIPRFVTELRHALGYRGKSESDATASAEDSLEEAIRRSIADHHNKRRRAREIADDINERALYRGERGYLSKASISAEIRRHPDLFDVNSAGVRLRSLPAFPAGHPAGRPVGNQSIALMADE